MPPPAPPPGSGEGRGTAAPLPATLGWELGAMPTVLHVKQRSIQRLSQLRSAGGQAEAEGGRLSRWID